MLYPVMVIASISVILFSVVGIATMTGHMPNASSQKSEVTVDAQTAQTLQADKDIKEVEPVKQAVVQKPKTSHVVSREHSTAPRTNQAPQHIAMTCASCGVVESVQVREVKGQGSGLGVVGGAVVGGILGHQMGNGRGNDLATVAGAVGGGFAGNEIEKNVKKNKQYVVRVRMEDGAYRTITQTGDPGVGIGDRVRIENGALVARG